MKNRILSRPTKLLDFDVEDFYLEISKDWERRAKALQTRRWEKIKHRERQGFHHDRRSPS